MIPYESSAWGLTLLFRLRGSAIVKAFMPAMWSTLGLALVVYFDDNLDFETNVEDRPIDHPYAIGALMAAFTFLLTFRANFAYGRYWEACTAVHQMLSKWLDVGMEMAAFHYQCNQYDDIRPPAFGKHPDLCNISRDRERENEMTPGERRSQISAMADESKDGDEYGRKTRSFVKRIAHSMKRRAPAVNKKKNINLTASKEVGGGAGVRAAIPLPKRKRHDSKKQEESAPSVPSRGLTRLQTVSKMDGGIRTPNPSLFLQETAHLLSLLSAVAMSTLRNDIEGTESPLIEYEPGSPWPPVDPDQLSSEIRQQYNEKSRFWAVIRYFIGTTRSPKNRTLYNAARPFRVLGGVSDAEIRLLQAARGPLGKVALVTMWFQEFISREYMAGSTGGVAPPIISRLYQFTSDGMLGYNQARKVAYIPFPFPHAQITVFFILAIIVFIPVLMFSYVNNMAMACVLNFFTVLCFTGLHEVARELEAPFVNVPNDLPLTTFQAQFNEALITMYAGFHPDAWWVVPKKSDLTDSSVGRPLLATVPENSEASRKEKAAEAQEEEKTEEASA